MPRRRPARLPDHRRAVGGRRFALGRRLPRQGVKTGSCGASFEASLAKARHGPLLWGFKEECRLGFFKGVLLKDPEGILVAPGENSRSSRTLNFTGTVEIERLANVISAYVREAIDLEKAGLKVDLPKDDLDLPAELITALDQDDALRAAFETLTPGRRRGWILHVSQPKQSATRRSRIEKAAPRILAGKGLHDR
ncbi:hypothetical protein EJC49_04805 [Aquibium carbonis]|uniref:YdhG-like domain-containing protein n=1 Tax=Aquibium carbonis TaxID=2495581 RepID=A0A429Z1N2_9HYPH|nr:hypothetical protein EJC49_04805 [Aquibium carbonis]